MTTKLEDKLQELAGTVAVVCIVDKATGYTRAVHHTPHSEIRYGGHTPSYRTGETMRLELEVLTNTPVKKILFSGWPPLQKGDSIIAYVLKAEVKHDPTKRIMIGSQYKFQTYMVDRDFKEEEIASKIEKIVNGEVVATYISG